MGGLKRMSINNVPLVYTFLGVMTCFVCLDKHPPMDWIYSQAVLQVNTKLFRVLPKPIKMSSK